MSKISELSDGGVIQGGDTLIAVRSGGNVKVTYGGSTTANIDGGTIDNTVIGGTTPAAGNFTTGSFTGNVSFGDNDKAIFGAGSDLQIYHDGLNSYIKDAGTGQLRLLAGTNVQIWNADATSLAANFNGDTQTTLHYAGDIKLTTTNTGIDVTGVVEATGYLAVEGTSGNTGTGTDRWIGGDGTAGTWFYNVPTGSNHYFAVNNTNVLGVNSTGIDVTGTVTADGLTSQGTLGDWSIDSQGAIQTFTRPSTSYIRASDASGSLRFDTGGSNARLNIANNGDISFYEDTGTTPKLFWDASAERLGLGTSSPATRLHLSGGDPSIRLTPSGTNDARIDFTNNAGTAQYYTGFDESSGHYIIADENGFAGSNVFTFTSAGNVGIGTDSPEKRLHIFDSTQANQTIRFGNPSATALGEINYDSSGYEHLYINVKGTTTGYGNIVFSTGPTPTEAMRIDSSGNVGIGTSSPANPLTVVGSAGTIASFTNGADADLLVKAQSAVTTLTPTTGTLAFGTSSTERMRIDSGGNAIFTKTNGAYLQLKDASAVRGAINVETSDGLVFTTGASFAERMRIDSSGNVQIKSAGKLQAFRSDNARSILVYTDNDSSTVESDTDPLKIKSADRIQFETGGANERMRIDSSGNLLVGKTNNTLSNDGTVIRTGGEILVTNTNDIVANFNRTGTNGSIVTLYKDGSTVGSIGVNGSHVYIGTNDTTLKMDSANNGIFPRGTDGAQRDAAIQLGSAGNRFTDLYLSGGAYLGGTGSANKLDDYEEGTFTPSLDTSDGNLANFSYNTRTGAYTKVGNIVTVSIELSTHSAASVSGTGIIRIKGLPFTVADNTNGGRNCLALTHDSRWTNNPQFGQSQSTTTSISLYKTNAMNTANAVTVSDMNATNNANFNIVTIMFTYRTS